MTDCMTCDLTNGVLPLPGGRVAETAHWVVEHTVGPLGVGTLVVKPLRHVLHVADLDAGESAELGPLLRRVAAAVTEVTEPDQVYVCLWSHSGGRPGHLHFVVQPITRAAMDRFGAHGPGIQVAMFASGEQLDPVAVAAVCDRLRSVLG
jgi:diadenosine tetraphosphate (Ap4A) HIT family hydrolase